MPTILTFYRLCIGRAWQGSVTRARTYASLLGAAALGLIFALLGLDVKPNGLVGSAALVIVCIAAAWLIIFSARLVFVAPFALWKGESGNGNRVINIIRQRLVCSFDPSDPLCLIP